MVHNAMKLVSDASCAGTHYLTNKALQRRLFCVRRTPTTQLLYTRMVVLTVHIYTR